MSGASIRPVDVKVNDVTFRIIPFDAFRQLELFGDLQKEILPYVGGVLSTALAKESERDETATINAFRELSSNFDGKTLKRWADLLLDPDYVTFEDERTGQPAKLNAVNRGMALADFAAILELMFHVGRVNFAAPLSRWAALSGLAQKAKAYLPGGSATSSSPSS